MTKPLNTHACALCSRQIGRSWLMCLPHWKLVPKPLQDQVYAAWRRVQGPAAATRPSHAELALARDEYFRARDAAIQAAAELLAAPAGLPVAVPARGLQ